MAVGIMLMTLVTLAVLFLYGIKWPHGMLAVYLNGMFLATLLLTDTGIPFFAGGSIVMLTAVALGYYWLRWIGFKELWQRLKGPLPILAVLIAFDLVLAFLYGTHSSYGVLKIVRYFSVDLVFFLGVILFAGEEQKLKGFLGWIAFWGLAYALSAVVGMVWGIPNSMYGWNNRIWFARALGLTLIAFYHFWGGGKQRRYGLILVAGIFFLLMMYLNSSRGPVLALYAAIVAYEIFDFSGVSIPKRLIKMAVISLLFMAIFWKYSPVAKPLSETPMITNQQITIADKFAEDAGGTANLRVIIWRDTLNIIKKHPVLGTGTGSLASLLPVLHDEQYRYPHNIFLEVMGEQGLPGLLLWLAFLLYSAYLSIRELWQSRGGNRLYLTGLVLLVYGVANAMVSGDITDNNYIFVASGLIWAVYLTERRSYQK